MIVTIGVLSSIAGIITSFIFALAPGLAVRYNALSSTWKKVIMAGATLVTGAAGMALSCYGLLDKLFPGVVLACTQLTGWDLMAAWIASFAMSQVTYFGLIKKSTPAQVRIVSKDQAQPAGLYGNEPVIKK